jgi:hypothetical protein
MRQASVQIDVIANLSSSNDLALNFAINLRHHAISAKTSPLRSILFLLITGQQSHASTRELQKIGL